MIRKFLSVFKETFWKIDPLLWILLFLFPLLLPFAMNSFFKEERPTRLSIGVVTSERGELVNRFLQGIDASPSLKLEMICQNASECMSEMRAGKIYAIAHIPNNWEKEAFRKQLQSVSVYVNAQSMLTAKLIINEMRNLTENLGAHLLSRHIRAPILSEIHSVGNPEGSYKIFLCLGLVHAFFHLLSMLSGAYVFGRSIRDNRLKELVVACENSFSLSVFARLLPIVLILFLEWLFVLSFVWQPLFSLSGRDLIIYFLGGFSMIFACASLGGAFVGLAWQMQFALGFSAVVGGPAFAFCGQTFPIFSMPLVAKYISFILPLTHMMKIQSAFLLGSLGRLRAFQSVEILAGMALFWFLVCVLFHGFRLKRLRLEVL